MRNVIGKPVTGDNFFGRDREVEQLARMAEHEHILLLAPRRVGKTSLLLGVQGALPAGGPVTAVYVSVGDVRSELDFVRAVIEAAARTPAGTSLRPGPLRRWLRRRGRQVKRIGVGPSTIELESNRAGWQEQADHAIDDLLAIDTVWLLMIDELPNMVLALTEQDASGSRTWAFLHWFRAVRQRPAGLDKLRFVLAGSVGLDSVTRRQRISAAINDLRSWQLGPYDAPTADAFLCELASAYAIDLTPEVRAHVRAHADWLIPYHLQVIFNVLREEVGSRRATVGDVDAAVERLLEQRQYFATWDERLTATVGRPHDDHARAMLTACALDADGASMTTIRRVLAEHVADATGREEARSWLLDVLVSDGYLVADGERWRFRSSLLRRYWRRYFT
ncbi:MAG TPA: hypothetical protein VHE35_21705 [Kofleriaceae bacterium]|nr:hypothetical protein [Kofleriaceae bacterium]